jgi:hypothetical protein
LQELPLSPRIDISRLAPSKLAAQHRLSFNADAVAIGLALTLAALIRFNVIHHIGW